MNEGKDSTLAPVLPQGPSLHHSTLPSPFSLVGWSFHTVTWGQLLQRPVPAVVVLQQTQKKTEQHKESLQQ